MRPHPLADFRCRLVDLIERRVQMLAIREGHRRIGAAPRLRFQWLKDVASRPLKSEGEIEQALWELIAFATLGGYDASEPARIASELPFLPHLQKLQRLIAHQLETLRTTGEIDLGTTYPTRWIWRPPIVFHEQRQGKRLTRRRLRKPSFVQDGTHSIDPSITIALLDTLRQVDADLGQCMTPNCGVPFIRARMDTLYCELCRRKRRAESLERLRARDRLDREQARRRNRKHYQNKVGRSLLPGRGRNRLS